MYSLKRQVYSRRQKKFSVAFWYNVRLNDWPAQHKRKKYDLETHVQRNACILQMHTTHRLFEIVTCNCIIWNCFVNLNVIHARASWATFDEHAVFNVLDWVLFSISRWRSRRLWRITLHQEVSSFPSVCSRWVALFIFFQRVLSMFKLVADYFKF